MKLHRVFVSRVLGAAIASAMAAPLVSAQPYIAAQRVNNGAVYVLEEGLSRIVELSPEGASRRQVQLAPAPGRRREWTGFARYRGEWWLADGTSVLYVYASDGRLVRRVNTPAPASDLFAGHGRMYVYDATPAAVAQRLWYTSDGRKFVVSSVAGSFVSSSVPPPLLVIAVHVLFNSSPDGIMFVPVVGPPVLTLADASGAARRQVPLAYSRSVQRAKNERVARIDVALEHYSAPVRDLLTAPGGDIIVLRNREDVRGLNGQVVPEQARRIDRYSKDGRHTGTATFPEKIRWIVAVKGASVVVMTSDGDIRRAPFGAPEPGQVLAAPGVAK